MESLELVTAVGRCILGTMKNYAARLAAYSRYRIIRIVQTAKHNAQRVTVLIYTLKEVLIHYAAVATIC
jgi:hypothetical protein